MNSALMIYRGSATEFVDCLCMEAKSHRALKHAYFDLFRALNRDEADEALRDFIFQYSFYSRHFDAYNDAVLSTVQLPAYRAVILENIADEQGTGEPGFTGLPHRDMYRQFAARIGVDDAYRASHKPLTTAQVWANCSSKSVRRRCPASAWPARSSG